MPWVVYNNRLKLEGKPHYEPKALRLLIERLRSYKRGNPDTVCNALQELLNTGEVKQDVIVRFSKWCTWDSPIQECIARKISYLLFGCYCERLTESDNKNNNRLRRDWKERYANFLNKVTHADYKEVFSRITNSMDRALKLDSITVILAKDAGPGNYMCVECGGKVHWRRLSNYGPQFYHWPGNPECRLYSGGTGGWDEEYYRERFNVNYRERWVETIDELWLFGNLEWLRGKDWAKNPLKFYLDEIKRNRSSEKDIIYIVEEMLSEFELDEIKRNKSSEKDVIYDVEEMFSEFENEDTGENEKDFFGIAEDAYKKKNYKRAIEYYSRTISQNETNPYPYNKRGISYARIKDYDNALKDFDKAWALSIDPKYGAAMHNKGVVYYEKGELDKSIECFTESLECDRYSIIRRYNRGEAYFRKEEYDNADKDYKWVLDIPSIDKRDKRTKEKVEERRKQIKEREKEDKNIGL